MRGLEKDQSDSARVIAENEGKELQERGKAYQCQEYMKVKKRERKGEYVRQL